MLFKKLKNEILEWLFIILYNIKVKIVPYIESRIVILIFRIQEKVDPSPHKKRNESDFDWYKRIDVEYALRHAKFSRFQFRYLEKAATYALKLGFIDQHPKKVQKNYKEMAALISIRAREYEDIYNTLVTKKIMQNNSQPRS